MDRGHNALVQISIRQYLQRFPDVWSWKRHKIDENGAFLIFPGRPWPLFTKIAPHIILPDTPPQHVFFSNFFFKRFLKSAPNPPLFVSYKQKETTTGPCLANNGSLRSPHVQTGWPKTSSLNILEYMSNCLGDIVQLRDCLEQLFFEMKSLILKKSWSKLLEDTSIRLVGGMIWFWGLFFSITWNQ